MSAVKRIRIAGDAYERFAVLCDLVYRRGPKLVNYGFDEHRRIADSDNRTICRIVWNRREIIIVFRGTQHRGDWLTNLKIWKSTVSGPGYKFRVHAGFWHALNKPTGESKKTVLEQIERIVKEELSSRDRKVFLLGHSLGGALATLTAQQLELKRICEVRGVFTFGQPSVGGRSFSKAYLGNSTLNKRTYRICSGIDIVTFLPFPFYRHVGNQVWIHNGEVMTDVIRWYRRIGKSLMAAMTSSFTSHNMKKYIRHGIIFRVRG